MTRYFEQKKAIRTVTMALIYIVSTLAIGLTLIAPQLADWLAVEDGPVETLTAVFLLAASISMLVHAFYLFRSKLTLLAVLSIMIAMAFFVFAGEEISWGQRILGIETGELLQEYNWQGETNIHNVQTDLFNIVYHYGALLFLIVLPLYRKQASWLFKKLRAGVLTHFIPAIWVAVPSLTLVALLDPRFISHIEKPYVAVTYLLALTIGIVILMHQLIKAYQSKNNQMVYLLSLSLGLIGLGVIASSIFHETASPNLLAEYKELIIATGLFSFAYQLASRTSQPITANQDLATNK